MLRKSINQIGFAHNSASCRIDEDCRRLHQIEMFPPDHTLSLWGLTDMHTDNIGTPEDVFKRNPLGNIAIGMECECNDLHAYPPPESGNFTSYRAGANQAQGFSAKLSS